MKNQTTYNEINALENDVEEYISSWHRFAVDYWWRKKYNIPFNSPQHRQANFIDMLFEFREELVLQRQQNKTEQEREERENRKLGIKKDTKEVIQLSQEQIEEDYDNLDLSQFDDK